MATDPDLDELRAALVLFRDLAYLHDQRAQRLEAEVNRLRQERDELRAENQRLILALTHG